MKVLHYKVTFSDKTREYETVSADSFITDSEWVAFFKVPDGDQEKVEVKRFKKDLVSAIETRYKPA